MESEFASVPREEILPRNASSKSQKRGKNRRRSASAGPARAPALLQGGHGDDLFELTPASIRVRLKHVLDESARTARGVRSLCATGAVSDFTTIEEVQRAGDGILSNHRDRLNRGDSTAITDLLGIDPVFIRVPWVRGALAQLERAGVFAGPRGRGRPRGWTPESYVVKTMIVALVDDRVAHTGESKEKIFYELAERKFERLKRETIKRYYYTTRRDPRFATFLVADEAKARTVSRRELQREIGMGLQPGRG